MTDSKNTSSPLIVVTGANGLVGSRICAALVERGARVRAVVRRAGTAPALPGIEEHVGDFYDPDFAAAAVEGATGVVTTVHPMASDRRTQHEVAVEGTPILARRRETPASRGWSTSRPPPPTTGHPGSVTSTRPRPWSTTTRVTTR